MAGSTTRFWAGAMLGMGLCGALVLALHTTPAGAATTADPIPATDQSPVDPPFGAYLGACKTDSDCSGGNTCVSFNKRGNRCTHACQQDAECGAAGRCTKKNRCSLR